MEKPFCDFPVVISNAGGAIRRTKYNQRASGFALKHGLYNINTIIIYSHESRVVIDGKYICGL
jgi:hypothetical protein